MAKVPASQSLHSGEENHNKKHSLYLEHVTEWEHLRRKVKQDMWTEWQGGDHSDKSVWWDLWGVNCVNKGRSWGDICRQNILAEGRERRSQGRGKHQLWRELLGHTLMTCQCIPTSLCWSQLSLILESALVFFFFSWQKRGNSKDLRGLLTGWCGHQDFPFESPCANQNLVFRTVHTSEEKIQTQSFWRK